jgi:hypothetical protein
MSPWPRRIFSLILNPIANALTRPRRPDYQHHRDLTPVTPLGDDCLLLGDGWGRTRRRRVVAAVLRHLAAFIARPYVLP